MTNELKIVDTYLFLFLGKLLGRLDPAVTGEVNDQSVASASLLQLVGG